MNQRYQRYEGTAEINPGASMLHHGALYDSPIDAAAELVENEIDAGADRVWVITEPGKLIVVGNGHGLVPSLMPDDNLLFDMLLEDIKKGVPSAHSLSLADEIKHELSWKSFKMMMQSAAYSFKRHKPRKRVRGTKGLGILGFTSIGNRAVWYTRATVDMAEEFWGRKFHPWEVPTCLLVAPTAEMLAVNDRKYTIEEVDVVLRDPETGKELRSGTQVEVVEFKDRVEAALRPWLLRDAFSSRFSEDIRIDRLRLVIVDRVSEEGRKTKTGRIIPVEATKYRGVNIIPHRTLRLYGTDITFEVDLYLEVEVKRGQHQLDLRRAGSRVNDLTSLPQFNSPPWTELNGFVSAPDLPDTVFPWNSRKSAPQPSEILDLLVDELKKLEPEIKKASEEIRRRQNDEQIHKVGEDVGNAITEAMGEMDIFRDALLVPGPGETRKETRRRKEKGVIVDPPIDPLSDRVIIRAIDEWGQPVMGVRIFLEGEPVRVTQEGGRITYGKKPHGKYVVSVTVPPPFKVSGRNSITFYLSPLDPGHRATFYIETGLPKRTPSPEEVHLHPSIRVRISPLDDPDKPYSVDEMDLGWVIVNQEAEALAAAIAARDIEQQRDLVMLSAAMAVTEVTLPTRDPAEHHRNAFLLYGRSKQRVSRPSGRKR